MLPRKDGANWMRSWGLDISTKQIAWASSDGETRSFSVATEDPVRRLGIAYDNLLPWFRGLSLEHPPVSVWVEQPIGRVISPPVLFMAGVAQAAVYNALRDLHRFPVPVWWITPYEWKKRTVGPETAQKGKPKRKGDPYHVEEWCMSSGFDPHNWDEADALGIAVAGHQLFLEANPAEDAA